MTDINSDKYRKFTQSVIDNIKKNGFPDKKVSFPLDQLYDSAYNKGLNFNKVLETLDLIKIGHVKTTEKIIFYPKDKMDAPVEHWFDPKINEVMKHVTLDNFKGVNLEEMLQKANSMVDSMSSEQKEKMLSMYENMTDEEKQEMINKAKELGFK